MPNRKSGSEKEPNRIASKMTSCFLQNLIPEQLNSWHSTANYCIAEVALASPKKRKSEAPHFLSVIATGLLEWWLQSDGCKRKDAEIITLELIDLFESFYYADSMSALNDIESFFNEHFRDETGVDEIRSEFMAVQSTMYSVCLLYEEYEHIKKSALQLA